jgi:hypothetical protein
MMRRSMKVSTLAFGILLVSLVAIPVVAVAETNQSETFVSSLQSRGYVIVSQGVASEPFSAKQITSLASDPYEATRVASHMYHEAGLLKTRGAYPYEGLIVKVVNAQGVVLSRSGLAVSSLTLAPKDASATDEDSAAAAQKHLVAAAKRPLDGLDDITIDAATTSGERTLRVDVLSDGSATSRDTLYWLVIGATSEDGWVGELNETGAGIDWVEIRAAYASGLPDSLSVIDVAARSAMTYAGARIPDVARRPPTEEQIAARNVEAASYQGWVGNNWYGSAYGVRATVYTPTSAPSVYAGAIFGWVSTLPASGESEWAQAGWIMSDYDDHPQSFIEYFDMLTYQHHFIRVSGDLSFGSGRSYECRWNLAQQCWVIYVAGTPTGLSYTRYPAPKNLQVMNEIQGDSRNTLNYSRFTSVSYRNSAGTYYQFNQANWTENTYYKIVDKTYKYQWTANHR